jgi:hypothetical protein
VQGADLQQLVPVGVVSGQPRALQPEHDPGLAERDLGDQPLETLPVGCGGAGAALVDVDDDDVAVGPAQRGGLPAQVVLAARRFGVVGDLIQRRLSDIQVGVAAQMRGGDHGRGVVHEALPFPGRG